MTRRELMQKRLKLNGADTLAMSRGNGLDCAVAITVRCRQGLCGACIVRVHGQRIFPMRSFKCLQRSDAAKFDVKPMGVDVVSRMRAGKEYVLAIKNRREKVLIAGVGEARELVTGKDAAGGFEIALLDLAILERRAL